MADVDERKIVTVLFADRAGSTELATRHDPEALRALQAAFFDQMRQQIEVSGGGFGRGPPPWPRDCRRAPSGSRSARRRRRGSARDVQEIGAAEAAATLRAS